NKSAVKLPGNSSARCSARNANTLPGGTRCPAIISASSSSRSSRDLPCMRRSSQKIEHTAGRNAQTARQLFRAVLGGAACAARRAKHRRAGRRETPACRAAHTAALNGRSTLMRVPRAAVPAVAGAAVVTAGLSAAPSALALSNAHSSFLGRFRHLTTLASTVPSNGDVNPYGVAVVGSSQGRLHRGDVLVSNFNDKANLQGTGSTIVEISPAGHVTRFAGI